MTNSKTKTCQNCKTEFRIEPEDFAFYKKIDVPEPTFCPECRMARRMVSWNERVLYKQECDSCKKPMISIYSPDKPFKVYCNKCWWSDKWDGLEYGRNYDFSKPFFEQFYELQKEVPIINLFNKKSINSEYCHDALEMKNCYMMFLTGMCQDCLYGTFVIYAKDCVDNCKIIDSELCYFCVDCSKCYKIFFSEDCNNCHSSAFLFNCRNCSDCFGCVSLRHKKYHIFNKPYSKEEYQKEIKKYDLGSYGDVCEIKEKFNKMNIKFPRKYARIIKSVNVSGDEINNSKNCVQCFKTEQGTEDCKYVAVAGWNSKDCYDLYDAGLNTSFCYESVCCVENVSKALFTIGVWNGRNVEYSDYCQNSSNLFGCVSLRNKKYCIFNKQYTKEEYIKIVSKIKTQMDQIPYLDSKKRVYKYGEYFPIELSRFGYNESVAQLYFPLKKEEAIDRGYLWYDKPKVEYKPTIKAKDLPDNIKDVNNSILKEVIECSSSNCASPGVFRIVPDELAFYKKMNLSLPRICPDCRYREMFRKRTLFRLYNRKCQCAGTHSDNELYKNTTEHKHKDKHCPNKFQTTYAPERKEIIYCEECYNKEIG